LTCAVGIASQEQRSEIILCTDGLSNVGLGSMENKSYLKISKEYYNLLGTTAKTNGNIISVIGIEGEDCGISILGECAASTSGEVTIVKPFELQRKMRQIIDNPIIATDVSVNVILHPYLGIKKHGKVTEEYNYKVDIGNVSESSDICFSYGLSEKGTEIMNNEKLTTNSLPFQAQITYRKMDGTKCMRVITKKLRITKKREKCENNCDVAVISMTAIQGAARKSLDKKLYQESRDDLYDIQRLLDRIAVNDEQQEEYDIFIQKKRGTRYTS